MEVEFVQNSCIPRTIQIAGNDYQLSSCIDNSLISSEMMYLQFATDITQSNIFFLKMMVFSLFNFFVFQW